MSCAVNEANSWLMLIVVWPSYWFLLSLEVSLLFCTCVVYMRVQIWYVYVGVHMSAYVGTGVWRLVYMVWRPKHIGCLPWLLSFLFSEAESLTEQELPDSASVASQPAPGITCEQSEFKGSLCSVMRPCLEVTQYEEGLRYGPASWALRFSEELETQTLVPTCECFILRSPQPEVSFF